MNQPTYYLRALRYPRRAVVELHGIYRNKVFGGNGGQYVTEEDWDNLIILDACRYDLFKDVAAPQLTGSLQTIRSRGTHTGEFMEQNFAGAEHTDTVYVSSNPNPSEVDARFADVVSVWDDGWDDELHTVPPQAMTDATVAAAKEYPNKRIITHYLQPHYPFIGEVGREFHDKYGYTDLGETDNLWMKMRQGKVSEQETWEAYEENLEVVLPHVQTLLDELDGKTVITADHGNAFGEFGVRGHPPRAYISCLQDVPWFVADFEDRKEIINSQSSVTTKDESADIKERLADLGYVG